MICMGEGFKENGQRPEGPSAPGLPVARVRCPLGVPELLLKVNPTK